MMKNNLYANMTIWFTFAIWRTRSVNVSTRKKYIDEHIIRQLGDSFKFSINNLAVPKRSKEMLVKIFWMKLTYSKTIVPDIYFETRERKRLMDKNWLMWRTMTWFYCSHVYLCYPSKYWNFSYCIGLSWITGQCGGSELRSAPGVKINVLLYFCF